ncbi:MAG: hypothetical protein IJW40_09610 [Clostridia bacterium]|nr:hypothetical protein [Clostridia bacterium]
MKYNPLLKGTIIKTVFAGLEVMVLVGILIYSFLSAGESIWGYWGSIIAIISLLSPIYIYAIPNAIFTTYNLMVVTRNRHTLDSIKKYHKLSKRYLIWGVITGGLYGCLLAPIFLLENIFLYCAYRKELERIKNT